MRAAMHGREIDMVEQVKPELPHMLGITPLNKIHDPKNEEMTLLDTNHHFWQEYEEPIKTKNQAAEKLQTAIHSLREDDLFQMTYPHGEEAEVVYVEVEKPSMVERTTTLQTSCKNCSRTLTAQPNLLLDNERYYLRFSLDCPDCEFSRILEQRLHRL
jgi:hypothetical protein